MRRRKRVIRSVIIIMFLALGVWAYQYTSQLGYGPLEIPRGNGRTVALVVRSARYKAVRGEYAEAITDYQWLIQQVPATELYYLEIGDIYMKLDDYNSAMQFYQLGLQRKLDVDSFYFRIGRAYQAQNDYEHAIMAYSRAIELNHNNVDYYIGMGSMIAAQGDCISANMFFTKALALNPENSLAQRELTRCNTK